MADLDSVVSITITRATLGLAQRGFGVPMILSANAAFGERIRFYSDLDAVEDDFATTTVEWAMAAALFGQTIQPERIAIGRSANKPTQKYTLTPVVLNSTTYKLYINGTEVSITSDSSASDTEIVDAMATAINALSGVDTLTATTPGAPGTETLVLTANATGNYNSVEIDTPSHWDIVQDHADPGLAADLSAIADEDDSWYFILYPYNSKACALVIATYAEANKKLYVCDTSDSNNATLAIGSDTTTSTMGQLKTSARERTAPIYHPNPGDHAASAWVGRVAPLEPGSETWAHKTLSGPDAVDLTDTHITNIEAKNGNHYTTVGSANVARWGTVSSGEYIDVIRGLDWLESRIAEEAYAPLLNAKKVPFTDGGISVIQGAVQGVLNVAVDVGLLSNDPAPLCTVPKASAVSTANKAARRLTGVKFSGTLAGAVHKIDIAGNVSL